MYIPFKGGEHSVATQVTAFQIGTGDLVIVEILDFTHSSKEINGQNVFIVAEVREGMTAQDKFNRFAEGIRALEDADNEANGWKTTGKVKGKGKGKSNGTGISKA